jgi:hypothetical protein
MDQLSQIVKSVKKVILHIAQVLMQASSWSSMRPGDANFRRAVKVTMTD